MRHPRPGRGGQRRAAGRGCSAPAVVAPLAAAHPPSGPNDGAPPSAALRPTSAAARRSRQSELSPSASSTRLGRWPDCDARRRARGSSGSRQARGGGWVGAPRTAAHAALGSLDSTERRGGHLGAARTCIVSGGRREPPCGLRTRRPAASRASCGQYCALQITASL